MSQQELADRIHSRPLRVASLLGRCEAAHLAGDRDSAVELIARAVDSLEAAPTPGTLAERAAVVERRLRRGGPASRPTPRRRVVEELTDRELAVLRLLPSRLTQREIGETLYLSMNTVKTHTRNIFRKLSASSRDEAVEVALQYARSEGETLIVSTSDHETGGLTLGRNVDGRAVYTFRPEVLDEVEEQVRARVAAELDAVARRDRGRQRRAEAVAAGVIGQDPPPQPNRDVAVVCRREMTAGAEKGIESSDRRDRVDTDRHAGART